VLIVSALAALSVLILAQPPSQLERSLATFLAAFPGWLHPVWGFLEDLLAVWGIVLVAAVVVSRRWVVVLETIGALALGVLVAIVASRLALGHWPHLANAFQSGAGTPSFPALWAAACAAVVLTVGAHLVRPLQRAGRWIVGLGLTGALFVSGASPLGVLAALVIALAAAAGARLALGSSAGRPSLDDVAAALHEQGIAATALAPVDREVAGVFLAAGRDVLGRAILIKVYGRDAFDNRLLTTGWRTLMYRDSGPGPGVSRIQAVEHEAFVTFLARDAGVPVYEVVSAGATVRGDALLVLRGRATPLRDPSDDQLAAAWRTLTRLADANIAHLQIDAESVVMLEGEVGLIHFAGATATARPEQCATDRAQLLALTACLVGIPRAVTAAIAAIGQSDVVALLPFIQAAALGSRLRRSLRAAGIDADELQAEAAKAVDVDPPELFPLRRVTWGSIVQIVLLFFAIFAIASAADDVDYAELRTALDNASWTWIAAAFVGVQLTEVSLAVSTLGSIAVRVAFGRIYAMRLAIGYLNLALPSGIARMAVNVRFLQRQGLPAAAAVTSGTIDSVAGNLVQVALLLLLLVFTEANVALEFSAPTDGSLTLIAIVVAIVAASVLTVALVPRLRHRVVDPVRRWWPDVRAALGALRSGRKLALVVAGNLGGELVYAIALGLVARGFGYQISLAELLVIRISASLFASVVPVPGGIGVAEYALIVGLTSAGMAPDTAIAAVLLYRLATFYLPPIWGWFALRWLQRHRFI